MGQLSPNSRALLKGTTRDRSFWPLPQGVAPQILAPSIHPSIHPSTPRPPSVRSQKNVNPTILWRLCWVLPTTHDDLGHCNTGPGGPPSSTHQRGAADSPVSVLQVECAPCTTAQVVSDGPVLGLRTDSPWSPSAEPWVPSADGGDGGLRGTPCTKAHTSHWWVSCDFRTKATFLHCVRTACILRTKRLGYSPKNTYHLSSSTAKQQSPHENNETAFNLPTLNMSFFHKVQLGQTQNPCFLTPLQCFVHWQGKAHMPTLNMPFFHKVQLVQPRIHDS